MASQLNIERDSRLNALRIDAATRDALKECKPIIEPMIDDAIAESYRIILAYPEVQAAYAGMKLEDAVRAQRSHWLNDILPATFTEEQMHNCVELFGKRQKQGLALRWYFCFYSNMQRRMIGAIMTHYRRKPDHLQVLIDSLSRVVMFEVELAAAAYMHSAQEQASIVLSEAANQFEREVSGVVTMVASSVTQLQAAAQTMETVANQASNEAGSAASAAQRTSENINTVASATEQLTSSIHEISGMVGKSAQIADSAVGEAKRTNHLVQGLAETVAKIGDVVKLINNIASQTNLLALNATIEAARAGDAGKGFAVVAGEVKSLANQTAKATEEISAQIGAVQTATHDAVGAIQSIGNTIVNINEISTSVASAVEEQGAVTQEIARNIEGASRGGVEVSHTITTVNDLAGQTNRTAKDLSSAVATLSTKSTQLREQVAQFLSRIRAN